MKVSEKDEKPRSWFETAKMVVRTLTSTAVVVILIAMVINRNSPAEDERRRSVLDSLLAIERNFKKPEIAPRAFVGYGACIDLIASAGELFRDTNLPFPDKTEDFGVLHSQEEFVKEFFYYFQQGAAAERYVADRELFDRLVAASKKQKRVVGKLGGNAPVIALRMAREGAEVILGAQDSPDLPIGNVSPSGPAVDVADIHLILEYKKGEKIGPFTAPRANRFIIHADRYNPVIASFEKFKEKFDASVKPPNALVIGGLQMMEGYEYKEGERHVYFEKMKSLMAEAPLETKIHFELASFVDDSTLSEIKKNIIPYADSIGMNEQELPNLLSLMKTGRAISVADAYPRVASVLDQMREVYKLTKAEGYPRLLSRLHVHNIAFQAIMVRREAKWRKTMTATAISSLTAHRHVCQNEEIKLENSKLLMDESFRRSLIGEEDRVHLNPERPVSCWEETIEGDLFKICIAPVLVCTKVVQTVGGGDNISGAGLNVQI